MSTQKVTRDYNWRASSDRRLYTLLRIEKSLDIQVEQNNLLIEQNKVLITQGDFYITLLKAMIAQGDYHIPSPTREQMRNQRAVLLDLYLKAQGEEE